MIIDVHTHVGVLSSTLERPPVTFENLIERLDDEAIDRALFDKVTSANALRIPPQLRLG